MRSREDPSCPLGERPPEAYARHGYESLNRMIAYCHQVDVIRGIASSASSILEIGIGSGFLRDHLVGRGYSVKTVDISEKARPTVVASIDALPFSDDAFDMVAAFEVLEHIPWMSVQDALSELGRVARDAVVVSVPNCRPCYPIQITLPRIGRLRWLVERPFKTGMVAPHVHEWEIGHGEQTLHAFRHQIQQAGLLLETDYRLFECPYTHMFVLKVS